jgi:hypothetical protein
MDKQDKKSNKERNNDDKSLKHNLSREDFSESFKKFDEVLLRRNLSIEQISLERKAAASPKQTREKVLQHYGVQPPEPILKTISASNSSKNIKSSAADKVEDVGKDYLLKCSWHLFYDRREWRHTSSYEDSLKEICNFSTVFIIIYGLDKEVLELF